MTAPRAARPSAPAPHVLSLAQGLVAAFEVLRPAVNRLHEWMDDDAPSRAPVPGQANPLVAHAQAAHGFCAALTAARSHLEEVFGALLQDPGSFGLTAAEIQRLARDCFRLLLSQTHALPSASEAGVPAESTADPWQARLTLLGVSAYGDRRNLGGLDGPALMDLAQDSCASPSSHAAVLGIARPAALLQLLCEPWRLVQWQDAILASPDAPPLLAGLDGIVEPLPDRVAPPVAADRELENLETTVVVVSLVLAAPPPAPGTPEGAALGVPLIDEELEEGQEDLEPDQAQAVKAWQEVIAHLEATTPGEMLFDWPRELPDATFAALADTVVDKMNMARASGLLEARSDRLPGELPPGSDEGGFPDPDDAIDLAEPVGTFVRIGWFCQPHSPEGAVEVDAVCPDGVIVQATATPWLVACLDELAPWVPAPMDCMLAAQREGWRQMWRPALDAPVTRQVTH